MKEIKEQLKAMAIKIRKDKAQLKVDMRAGKFSGQSELESLRFEFRHRHVAYCLVRGRTLEQIEPKSKTKLHTGYVQDLVEAYTLHCKIVKGELEKPATPDPDKLYVIVDDTLPKQYAAVQAMHAVAQFMLRPPKEQPEKKGLLQRLVPDKPEPTWKNGTLVVLKGSQEQIKLLAHRGWVKFEEPDLGGRLTAVAEFKPNDSVVRRLPLF
jgi:hypothetical protein